MSVRCYEISRPSSVSKDFFKRMTARSYPFAFEKIGHILPLWPMGLGGYEVQVVSAQRGGSRCCSWDWRRDEVLEMDAHRARKKMKTNRIVCATLDQNRPNFGPFESVFS